MMSIEHNYSSCSSYSWWFHSHSNDRIPRRSPWLNAALADLDETTMAMLNIIEEDADTFAKRAEMYYKKRPELIRVLEHMYLSHRSLAEQFDQLKSESIGKLLEPNLSYDVYSVESFDDPDLDQEEEEEEVHLDAGKEREEEAEEKIRKLREEIEGIKEEKERMKDEVDEKNEEKREVIRQLSMALDMVMEENAMLKRKLATVTNKERFVNRSSSSSGGRSTVLMEMERLKDIFLEKLFNGTRTKTLNSI